MTNQERIERQVLAWEGVTSHDHQFGGVEYRLGKREIGHFHPGMEVVDIPFPKKVRDEVISTGLAEPHHVLPQSGWISKWLREPGDVDGAIQLLERSFDLARAQAARKQARVDAS